MKLWRSIRRVLWVVGISGVVLLATVECLYRATLMGLPQLAPSASGAAAVRLVPLAWTAEEGAAARRVMRVLPWAVLRMLTAMLRARKGQARLAESTWLLGRARTEWTWLLPEAAPGTKAEAQGLRGLSASDFSWSRSAKLPLVPRGITWAARCSRFIAARGLAGSPSSASFS